MTVLRLRSAAALTVAALAAGCGSLAPEYERPALPVPATVGAAEAGGAGAVDAIDWRRYYTDARLQALIAQGLAANRDLRVAVLNIEAAQAQYRIQRADRLPTVNAALSGVSEPGTNGNQSTVYTVGLAVSGYELDLFGRVRNLSDAALARYLATAEARKAAQLSLIASIAQVYYSRIADDEYVRLAEETLRTRESSLSLMQLRFDNGVSSELDVRAAQSLVESARTALAQYIAQRRSDDEALALLIGGPLPSTLPAPGELATAQPGVVLPAGLPSELLLRRPDIRQAEQTLVAANANIGAARAALLPRISLTGSAGFASTQFSELFTSGRFAWTASPSITLPIFDSGRNEANVEVAKVQQRIAIAQYESAVQAAFRDVAVALSTRQSVVDQLRSQQALADSEEARLRLTDMRFKAGVASTLELLDAQRSSFSARLGVVQTRLAQAQNWATLYKAMGGGWTDEPATAELNNRSTAQR